MTDIMDVVEIIIRFFRSEEFLIPAKKTITLLKTLSIFGSLLLVINIVLLMIKTNFYRNFYLANVKGGADIRIPEKKLRKRWQTIQKNAESKNPASYKLAVIDADRLVDHVLDMAGVPGENMDEQLANTDESLIRNIEDLRRVHVIAKHIVEDTEFVVSYEEAKEAVNVYTQSLNDMDIDL